MRAGGLEGPQGLKQLMKTLIRIPPCKDKNCLKNQVNTRAAGLEELHGLKHLIKDFDLNTSAQGQEQEPCCSGDHETWRV